MQPSFNAQSDWLDASVNQFVDPEAINRFIEDRIKGRRSNLHNIGHLLLDQANQYHMNVLFSMGHICNESAYGTSDFSLNLNNDIGYGAYDSNPQNAKNYKWSTVEDCIRFYFHIMANNWLESGNSRYQGSRICDVGGPNRPLPYWTSSTQADTIAEIANEFVHYQPVVMGDAPVTPNESQAATTSVEPEVSHVNMKLFGNTGNPENPGQYNSLSAICNHLGLPANPTSYELLYQWNPGLKSGSYDIIPSNFDVYIPETYVVPQPVVEPQPQPEPQPEIDYEPYTIVSGDTLSEIYVRHYPGHSYLDSHWGPFLQFIESHNPPQGFSSHNPSFIEAGWVLHLPKSL